MEAKKAFTLVELLVAMAIIAILLGLAVFGITVVQQSARDTQRRAVLRDIEVALTALLTQGATSFTVGTYATGNLTFNTTQVLTLTGPTARIAAEGSSVNGTTSSATDYCAGFSGTSYVVGLLTEGGSYAFVNNTGSTYSQSGYSASISATTGTGPACADATL